MVVVPVFNGAAYLAETLSSLLAQTIRGFRLVVLDNASTDGTPELAEKIGAGAVEVVRARTQVSMTENWNRAIDLADTPYFVLAHADDLYAPIYLETLLGLVERHEKAFLAHCSVTDVDESSRDIDSAIERYKDTFWPHVDPYEAGGCDRLKALRRGNFILAPSVIFRTAAVRQIGPFNEDYLFVPDWEYWIRGTLAGYTIVSTRERLVRYRRHAASMTSAHEKTLVRYREEIKLLTWLAAKGVDAGCFEEDERDFSLVANTLTSEFADRIARGDHASARSLLAFARAEVPGFRGSPRDWVLDATGLGGKPAGRILARLRDYLLRRSIRE